MRYDLVEGHMDKCGHPVVDQITEQGYDTPWEMFFEYFLGIRVTKHRTSNEICDEISKMNLGDLNSG